MCERRGPRRLERHEPWKKQEKEHHETKDENTIIENYTDELEEEADDDTILDQSLRPKVPLSPMKVSSFKPIAPPPPSAEFQISAIPEYLFYSDVQLK